MDVDGAGQCLGRIAVGRCLLGVKAWRASRAAKAPRHDPPLALGPCPWSSAVCDRRRTIGTLREPPLAARRGRRRMRARDVVALGLQLRHEDPRRPVDGHLVVVAAMREEDARHPALPERGHHAAGEDHQVVEDIAVGEPHRERVASAVRLAGECHVRVVDIDQARHVTVRRAEISHVVVEAGHRSSPRQSARLRGNDHHAEFLAKRERRTEVVSPAAEAVQHHDARDRRAGFVRLRHVQHAVAAIVGQAEPALAVRHLVLHSLRRHGDARGAARVSPPAAPSCRNARRFMRRDLTTPVGLQQVRDRDVCAAPTTPRRQRRRQRSQAVR